MLRVTRSKNVVWHAVAKYASPGLVHRQMNVIITVAIEYISGIVCWPVKHVVAEISALS